MRDAVEQDGVGAMKLSVKIALVVCFVFVLLFSFRTDATPNEVCFEMLAHAGGDSTEVLKNWIGYLAENGKIGEAELTRMEASATPIGPFDPAKHVGDGLIVHARAIDDLLKRTNVDWEEVRRFIAEIRRKRAQSEEARAVADKATEPVVIPRQIGEVKRLGTTWLPAGTFVNHGRRYIVEGGPKVLYVHDLLTGEVVRKIELKGELSHPAFPFPLDDAVYLSFGAKDGHLYTYDLVTGREVSDVDLKYGRFENELTLFEKDKKLYAIGESENHVISTVDLFAGSVVASLSPGWTYNRRLFWNEGDPYLILTVRNVDRFDVYEALTGKAIENVSRTLLPCDQGWGPTIVSDGGKAYLVLVERGKLHVGARAVVREAIPAAEKSGPLARLFPWFKPRQREVARIEWNLSEKTKRFVSFNEKGKAYLALRSHDNVVAVHTAVGGEQLWARDVSGFIVGMEVVIKNSKPCLLVSLANGSDLPLVDAITGETVGKINSNRTTGVPWLFFDWKDGNYAVEALGKDLRIYETDGGGVVSSIRLASGIGLIMGPYSEGDFPFVGVPSSGHDSLLIYQLVGPPPAVDGQP